MMTDSNRKKPASSRQAKRERNESSSKRSYSQFDEPNYCDPFIVEDDDPVLRLQRTKTDETTPGQPKGLWDFAEGKDLTPTCPPLSCSATIPTSTSDSFQFDVSARKELSISPSPSTSRPIARIDVRSLNSSKSDTRKIQELLQSRNHILTRGLLRCLLSESEMALTKNDLSLKEDLASLMRVTLSFHRDLPSLFLSCFELELERVKSLPAVMREQTECVYVWTRICASLASTEAYIKIFQKFASKITTSKYKTLSKPATPSLRSPLTAPFVSSDSSALTPSSTSPHSNTFSASMTTPTRSPNSSPSPRSCSFSSNSASPSSSTSPSPSPSPLPTPTSTSPPSSCSSSTPSPSPSPTPTPSVGSSQSSSLRLASLSPSTFNFPSPLSRNSSRGGGQKNFLITPSFTPPPLVQSHSFTENSESNNCPVFRCSSTASELSDTSGDCSPRSSPSSSVSDPPSPPSSPLIGPLSVLDRSSSSPCPPLSPNASSLPPSSFSTPLPTSARPKPLTTHNRLKSKMMKLVKRFLNVDLVPDFICIFCYLSVEKIQQTPTVNQEGVPSLIHWAITNLYFLRFLLPSLTSLSLPPSISAVERKTALLISKFFLKLCTRTNYDEYSGPKILRDVLENSFKLFDNYCDKIMERGREKAMETEDQKNGWGWLMDGVEGEEEGEEGERMKKMHAFLGQQKSDVEEVLKGLFEEEKGRTETRTKRGSRGRGKGGSLRRGGKERRRARRLSDMGEKIWKRKGEKGKRGEGEGGEEEQENGENEREGGEEEEKSEKFSSPSPPAASPTTLTLTFAPLPSARETEDSTDESCSPNPTPRNDTPGSYPPFLLQLPTKFEDLLATEMGKEEIKPPLISRNVQPKKPM